MIKYLNVWINQCKSSVSDVFLSWWTQNWFKSVSNMCSNYVQIVFNLLLHFRHTLIFPPGGRKGAFFQSCQCHVNADAPFMSFASTRLLPSATNQSVWTSTFQPPGGTCCCPCLKSHSFALQYLCKWLCVGGYCAEGGRGAEGRRKDVPFHTFWFHLWDLSSDANFGPV